MPIRKSGFGFVTVSLALLTNGAGAAEPGFYLAVAAARSEENPKSAGRNFGNSQGIFHADPVSVEIDDGKTGWGVGLGYQINRYLAAEVEYVSFGTTDVVEDYVVDIPGFPIASPANFTIAYASKVTGPALSLLGTFPLGDSFQVFLRGGALFASREVRVDFGAVEEQFADTVWLAGAGVAWSLAERWAIRAEFQHTGTFGATSLAGETELRRVSLAVLFDL